MVARHAPPTDLRSFLSRKTRVDLSATLSFEVLEVLLQARPGHWARIWPTAIAVSRWLLDQRAVDLPRSAKELGCGLGLVSMTLAHLGVVVEGTDLEPKALAFAAVNARRNDLVGFSVSHLDWSEPEGASSPYIVASDVLYRQETPGRLFDLLQGSGLLRPDGRFLVGGPSARPEPLDRLVTMLRAEGYSHQAETRSVEWLSHTEDIDIHVLRRPAEAPVQR
jgi:predicted nicotinamide N-methyase